MKKKRLSPVSVNIRRLRLAKGITQLELGRRVGEHKSVISHWERGRYSPTARKLPTVAKELDVTVDQLLARMAAA